MSTFLQNKKSPPPSGLSLSIFEKLTWYLKQEFTAQALHAGEYISRQMQRYDWLERIEIIGEIDQILMQTKVKEPERVNLFKHVLCNGKSSNWKDSLLGLSLKPLQKSYFMTDHSNYDIAYPIQFGQQRFKRLKSAIPQVGSCSILGSTFAANKSTRLNSQNINHILDAVYAACSINKSGTHDFMFALGDGCGGHFGEMKQDKMISRAAYFACKQAVIILAACPHPEILIRHIPDIVAAIGKEVRRKITDWQRGVPWQEGCALVAARAFKQPDNYRLLGFNLGDTMLISWHPNTQTFNTIAPAHQAVYAWNQKATAILPIAYKPHEIYPIDMLVPEGTLLMPLSDGMYEYLPCTKKQGAYPDGTNCEPVCLEEQAMVCLLKRIDPKESIQTFLEAIAHANITECECECERQRQRQRQQ